VLAVVICFQRCKKIERGLYIREMNEVFEVFEVFEGTSAQKNRGLTAINTSKTRKS
jgi:hypothetical protein